ncbi:SHOCT domain-containing protein [Azonexus sp.]
MEKLHNLFQSGALTEEEFKNAKTILISEKLSP